MTIPYLLPIDITIVLFCKVWQQVPAIKKELKSSLFNLLNFLRSLLTKMESKRHLYSAKFSCQLAVTEFDYSHEDSPQVYLNSQKPTSRKLSTINIPKKKLSHISSSKIEKAHSFSGRRNNQFDDLLKLKQQQQQKQDQQQVQRKSYAGSEMNLRSHNPKNIDRRRSMIEMGPIVKPPERVISKLNFGFTFDLKNKSQENLNSVAETPDSEPNDDKVIDSLNKLEDIDQKNAIEIANKALDWERECLEKYHEFGDHDTDIDEMIEVTKNQDALMAFYYLDENNRVKVTEIFNISEPEDSKTHNQQKINLNDDEDGLPETPLPTISNLKPTKSILSANASTSQRRRKKSVVLID